MAGVEASEDGVLLLFLYGEKVGHRGLQVFQVIEHAGDEGAEAGFEGVVLLVFAVEGHVAFALLADDAVDDHAHGGFDGLLVGVAYNEVLVVGIVGNSLGDVHQLFFLVVGGGFPAAEPVLVEFFDDFVEGIFVGLIGGACIDHCGLEGVDGGFARVKLDGFVKSGSAESIGVEVYGVQ